MIIFTTIPPLSFFDFKSLKAGKDYVSCLTTSPCYNNWLIIGVH